MAPKGFTSTGITRYPVGGLAFQNIDSNSVAAFDENGAQIGIVFQTAAPLDTPRLMTALVAWVKQERETRRLHPLM
jgi:hypothetical protein